MSEQPQPLQPSAITEIIEAASTQDAAVNYSDKLAKAEGEDKFEDHQRAKQYKKHIHVIVVLGVYVIGVIILAMVLIRAWHLVTPDCYKWLDDGQLHSIDAVLFSSIIFSLASKYFSYYKLFQKS